MAAAQRAAPGKGQRMQEAMVADVPHCARPRGTLSVVDGDDPRPWTQYGLSPPSKLLKMLVQRSGCFTLVDRVAGLSAAERERDIGGGLGLQRRSNVGQGQIRAADYVLVAELQNSNANTGGGGAAIGGLTGGSVGGLLGAVRTKKMEANTVLSITDVRTTETIATQDGYAATSNLSVGAGGAAAFGGAIGGGYDDTDIGRTVTLSFIQAYTKMVEGLALVRPGDEHMAEAAPSRTFAVEGPAQMRFAAGGASRLMRTLPPGSIVYPTGKRDGLWWEVADENDNVGWMLNTRLRPEGTLKSATGRARTPASGIGDPAGLPSNTTAPPVADATRLQSELQNLAPGNSDRARTLVAQPTTLMRSNAGFNYAVVKTIPGNATLRETGRRSGAWIEVVDETGVRGWIPAHAPR